MADSMRYILVDDEDYNNKVCMITIHRIQKDADVVSFVDPVKAFAYITSTYSVPGNDDKATLFLDINMPKMNGWEFLERFELLDGQVKERIKIYIVSSSVDKRDTERAQANKNVVDYFIKPLTMDTIKKVLQVTNDR